jgi:hypothetical protein
MSSYFLPFCRFHLYRLFQEQPVAFVALLASGLALMLATLVWFGQWQRAEEAEQAVRLASQHPEFASASPNLVLAQQVALPGFDSAQLVSALHQVAAAAKLPIDEVSFVLDDTANQPYLRYRVKLTVSATYPVIRRFVDRFRSELMHVSLDAITCARSDIVDVKLTCDLALSAFYRKSGHG